VAFPQLASVGPLGPWPAASPLLASSGSQPLLWPRTLVWALYCWPLASLQHLFQQCQQQLSELIVSWWWWWWLVLERQVSVLVFVAVLSRQPVSTLRVQQFGPPWLFRSPSSSLLLSLLVKKLAHLPWLW